MKKYLLLIPLLLLISCSVQKRHYQKGFYFSNSNYNHSIKEKDIVVKKQEPKKEEKEQKVFASTMSEIIIPKYQSLYTVNPDSLCDIILLKNGDDIKAKVLEISPIEIKYKKCLSPDGPLYIVKKLDVFMIKYSNGTKEVIDVDKTNEPDNTKEEILPDTSYTGPKTLHPKAKSALIFAWFGLIPILGIFACIKAIVDAGDALKDIKQNPNRYTGEKKARNAKKLAFAFLLVSFGLLFILQLALA